MPGLRDDDAMSAMPTKGATTRHWVEEPLPDKEILLLDDLGNPTPQERLARPWFGASTSRSAMGASQV